MDYRQLAIELLEKKYLSGKEKYDAFAKFGSDSVILVYIEKMGCVLPKDISDTFGVSTARIAIALNELESRELITRHIDESDRRRIIVSLTPKGKEVSRCQMEMFVKSTTNLLEELGEHDAREYVRIIGRVVEITKKRKCEQCN